MLCDNNIKPLKSKSYRGCLMCKNTSVRNPEKVFIQVPKDQERRRLWFPAMGRNYDKEPKKSCGYVCEDHFDLQNDMENYVRWKLTGGVKVMKKTVVPRYRLDCEENTKKGFLIAPIKPIGGSDCQEDSKGVSTSAFSSADLKRPKMQLVQEALPAPSRSTVEAQVVQVLQTVPVFYLMESHSSEDGPKKDVGITVKPHLKSKGTQTSVLILSSKHSEPKASSSYSCVSVKEQQDISKIAVEHTTRIVNLNPWHYIGLREECMFVIYLIEQYTHLNTASIFLTLQQIRLSQSFRELGDAYGMSESAASRTFLTSVSLISELMREFIIWPLKEKIRTLVPLLFKPPYNNMQFIIDSFEIQIQKPICKLQQALTWSDYKKTNTLKYLVSMTPDGVINFISNAFGGSTSDAFILVKSGFLDRLEPGAVIMADRGFNHIEELLIQKQCTLLRPPGLKNSKCTKLNKIVFLMRIHIEQVIRRLQEFKVIQLHSCVSSKIIPYMDFIIVIACGLVNLQGPIE